MNRLAAGALAIALAAPAAAGFRQLDPIAAPGQAPSGMAPVALVRPLPRELVEDEIRRFLASWNTPDLARYIDQDFVGRERLLEAMDIQVPRDASLRILAIQGVQTLEQYAVKETDAAQLITSVVSATVRSQVEFDDPVLGHQRLGGMNELILAITVRVVEGGER